MSLARISFVKAARGIKTATIVIVISGFCIGTELTVMAQQSELGGGLQNVTVSPCRYFPRGAFDVSNRTLSDERSDSLSDYLRAAREPCLTELSNNAEASYRLTWQGDPAAKGVILRLTIAKDGTGMLTTKLLSREQKLSHSKIDNVTPEQIQEFLQMLQSSSFWSLPSAEPIEAPLVKDGSTWVIEGAREDGAYHAVYRRNPKPSKYTELGRFLAKDVGRLDDSVIFVPQR